MNFQNKNKRKRRKFTKKKLLKCAKGSISIFLCLLLTPFMSIAMGLVEYSRYQSVIEVADECVELAGISALSDYDTYIHNRFGLLCTTQEQELGTIATSHLENNVDVIGSQIKLDSSTVSGLLSLANEEVLRQQVIDVSELTATTAVIAEDFKLDELLAKLQNISQFQDIMNTVDGLADLTDSISNVVDKLESLKTSITELQSAISTAVTSATELANKMSALYTTLNNEGIFLPENASADEIQTTLEKFCDSYLEDIENIYISGKNFVDDIKGIKNKLENLKSATNNFVTAVEQAQTAAENITSSNSGDLDGSMASATTETLEDVLDEMVSLVEDTLSEITDETVDAAKQAVDDIIDSVLENTGLAGITERYQEIVSGDYFALPLSDVAKQDLIDLLTTVREVCTTQSTNDLVSYFEEKFVPKIDINVDGILADVKDILANATNVLTKDGDKLFTLLTNLVNVVKGLFDLDLFYEADLNAFVALGNTDNSPYQPFLVAIGDLFEAVENFTNSISGADIFGILDAMRDMFTAIGDMLEAIFEIAGAAVNSIVELGKSAVTGNVRGLYEKLLISGYMRHNLPCRLNSANYKANTDDGNREVIVELTGQGLTGFSYNKIARPAISGQEASASGFQALGTFIQNLKNGSGTDKMFKGAELEYIRAGTNSELANQVIVFMDLYFLRLLLDLPSVFMDGEVSTVAAAATIASWVVYILYIIAEPFCDTLLLVNGAEVPLIRTDCWLTATGLMDFVNTLGQEVFSEVLQKDLNDFTQNYASGNSPTDANVNVGGSVSDITELGYQTYVLLLLLLYVDSDTMVSRLQNLVELEATAYYGEFNIYEAYTAVEVEANVTFKPFFDLGTNSGGNPLIPSSTIKQTVSY